MGKGSYSKSTGFPNLTMLIEASAWSQSTVGTQSQRFCHVIEISTRTQRSAHITFLPPSSQSKRQKLKDSSASAYIGAGPLDGGEGSGGNGGAAIVTSDGGKDVRG